MVTQDTCSQPTPSTADRQRLVERNLDLPWRAAHRFRLRCAEYFEFDELVALGNVGLAEAASRFDPSAGVRFRVFAAPRVDGAILDELRTSSALPRKRWQQVVALSAAIREAEQHAHQAKADTARARKVEALRGTLAAITPIRVASLEDAHERDLPVVYDQPVDQLHRRHLREAVNGALGTLSRQQQHVVRRHYWSDLTLLAAGAELGMSKSSASRTHASAIARLRRWCADNAVEL